MRFACVEWAGNFVMFPEKDRLLSVSTMIGLFNIITILGLRNLRSIINTVHTANCYDN